MSASPANPARERLTLTVLAGVQFGTILDFVLMMPLGPQFMRLFQITPEQFSYLIAIYLVAGSLSSLAAAFLVDRFDRRTTLAWALGGFAATALLCANAGSYTMLLTARAIAGAFGGVLGPTVLSIISDVIPEGRRGRAIGIVMSAFSLTTIIGVPLCLYFAGRFDWRAPFFAIAALMGCMAALALGALPPVRAHVEAAREHGALKQMRLVFTHRNHLRAYLFAAITMFAGFTVIPFISTYMVKNVGVKETELAIIYLCGGTVTLFAQLAIGRYSDLHGKRRVFVTMAAISILPLLLITHLPPMPLWSAVLAATLLMSSVSGRFVPAMAIVTSAAEPRLRGSFMSFTSSIQQLSTGGAVFMAGKIISDESGKLTRYGTVGWIAVGFTLVAIWLSGKIKAV